jgi:choline dehydrogenase-like flavoprotein
VGRARGIEIITAGVAKRINAVGEVIVTAGATGSPKLLMLSGIGPVAHLREVGVAVAHDLPGVGQNFHDHFSTPRSRLQDQTGL